MKARKINLAPYTIPITRPDGSTGQASFNVKDNLIDILLSPQLKLTGKQIYKRGKLADRIEKSKDSIVLPEEEYNIIKNAADTVRGFSKFHQEFLKRIYEAKEVELKESKNY